MNRAALTATVLFVFCLVSHTIAAAALDKAPGIPASLAPWQEWVLHDKADWSCPTHFNNGTIRRCWWPSRLIVAVGNRGGLFEQQVIVYGPTWVTLPGDETHWPESVSSGGTIVPVVGRNGRPCIWLETGDYLIKGAFVWNTLPEILQAPASTGILTLTIDGREIDEPDLDLNGRLRLHGTGGAARREDTMTATLFRSSPGNPTGLPAARWCHGDENRQSAAHAHNPSRWPAGSGSPRTMGSAGNGSSAWPGENPFHGKGPLWR